VLEIIATWKFPRSPPCCAQYAVTEDILRQTGDLVMKTISRSWINVGGELIRALSCIEPRMFISSFIFMPTFPQRRIAGQQPQGSDYLR